MSTQHSTPRTIAALVYQPGTDPSPVLEKVVRALQQRGVALAGAIQHSDGPCSMELELLPSGRRLPISQNLGSGASGCRLDTVALAEAASIMRRAIDASPQLVVFNKFGAQEAAGRGLRDEMTAAAVGGLPVLTAVSAALLNEWSDFTGGGAVQLPCSVDAALAWWDALATD